MPRLPFLPIPDTHSWRLLLQGGVSIGAPAPEGDISSAAGLSNGSNSSSTQQQQQQPQTVPLYHQKTATEGIMKVGSCRWCCCCSRRCRTAGAGAGATALLVHWLLLLVASPGPSSQLLQRAAPLAFGRAAY